MEVVMSECKHGIPLVNGIGCVVCSNKTVAGKVYVKFERGSRVTEELRRLSRLGADKVEEVSVDQFI